MNKRISIKRKLVIYFGSILIVGLIINGIVAGILCQELIKDKTQNSFQMLIEQYADKIDILLKQRKQCLRLLSEEVKRVDEKNKFQQQLKNIRYSKETQYFQDVVILDKTGDYYSMNGDTYEKQVLSRYHTPLENQTVTIKLDEIKGQKVLTCMLSFKVKDEIFTLVGMETLTSFKDTLRRLGIQNEIFILDEKNHTIVSNIQDIESAAFQQPKNFSKAYREQPYQDKKMFIWEDEGEENLMIYTPIEMGWTTGIVYPKEVMTEPIQLFWRVIAFSTCIIISIVLIGVYFISKNLSVKIHGIVSCLDIVASGNLEQPIPHELLEMKDEMGDVARALDHVKIEIEDMLQTIKSYTDYMNDQMEIIHAHGEGFVENRTALEDKQSKPS